MSASQLQSLHTLDAPTLQHLLAHQSVTLIDVREPGEFAGEHIPGATLLPLSQFDWRKVPQDEATPVVLYCRSGRRSQVAAQKLLAAGFKSVSHLDSGLEAWKAAGFTTRKQQHAPISLMRQVQIVAGGCVVLGTLLGVLVSPWGLILSGGVGAGLLFAGLTDSCLLARLLAQLPYNQRG